MLENNSVTSLLDALNFVSVAQRDKGAPYQRHTALGDNYATASDGVLSAGHRIVEDLQACPHTLSLIGALKQCQKALSVTQLDSGRLSVRSGPFKAFIACQPDATIANVAPDPACGYADNRLREALNMVSPLIVEESQRVVTASALIRNGSVIGTNGFVLIEYWHGIELPTTFIVPKLFINALKKIKKDIVSFGYSEKSLTVHFFDNSWLKTQVYVEAWPDCDAILNKEHKAAPLPADFFTAVRAITPFAQEGRLYLRKDKIQTEAEENAGASYDVPNLDVSIVLSTQGLALIDSIVQTIDLRGNSGMCHFYGNNIRGAITQLRD